ncbi:MAG TPA: hypothetical protein P5013_03745 [Methanoregula sp.]|nr:hypothetical protein [Methanoregula sp.]
MKTENCTEMTDARSIELKSGLAEPEKDLQNGFIVPAGILIGLGAGLLADHAVAGFLVGLGLGLLGSELLPLARKSQEGEYPLARGANVTLLLIGAVLVLAGISIVWAPAAIWIYAIPGLMILAGIGVLVRGFAKTS